MRRIAAFLLLAPTLVVPAGGAANAQDPMTTIDRMIAAEGPATFATVPDAPG